MYGEGLLSPSGGESRGSWFWSGPGIATDLGLMGYSWMHGRSLRPDNLGNTMKRLGIGNYGFAAYKRGGVPGIDRRIASMNPQGPQRVWGTNQQSRARRVWGPGGDTRFDARISKLRQTSATASILGGKSAKSLGVQGDFYKGIESYKNLGKYTKWLGVGFLVQGMFDLGMSLFTPGTGRVSARDQEVLFADESVIDSAAAFTQRQRALQAIHDSQTTTRSLIGQEARYLHR